LPPINGLYREVQRVLEEVWEYEGDVDYLKYFWMISALITLRGCVLRCCWQQQQ
jgi:hypothetical protein